MQADTDSVLNVSKSQMDDSIKHLKDELLKIRTGKAYPSMVNSVMVSYYGAPTPLNQVANVTAVDSRTLAIQPWDKSIIDDIEKAIIESNLGYNPMNDGEFIRIPVPPLTEERRKTLVKQAKALGEDTKVSIRSTRKEALDVVKKATKDGFPEDAGKRLESKIDDLVKKYYESVDNHIDAKEKDILTI
ncbi:ribosome recycling factor [Membranihabitans maritimus]|uniref:ribosome recycling factor n=1 Tax=Membranihabitans maritimus TaxID=2904244 RepID=UPI001F00BDD6|nr:ribosome recycling factor [Membranihabitans maritimus]